MILIDRDEVYEKLTMPRCISLMKEAFAGLARGVNTQIVRTGMRLDNGALAFMPCSLGERGTFGAKIISVYPGNSQDGYPSHQGEVLLFESAHGTPVALADACAITEIRTAAASAAATDLLARPDAHALAMLGSGAQAVTHLEAMLAVRPVCDVYVWSPTPSHAADYAARMAARYPRLALHLCASPREAAQHADILCTVCRSRDPFLTRDMVQPGAHINAVGTCSPVSREVSSDLVAAARLYVDQVEACRAESGEYLIPLKEGLITESHIQGSIGDVLTGKARGRESMQEITLFDSLGLAMEDVICADDLYREKIWMQAT
ncbi:MAG: ornithine cyclodeaminase family protein [Clostridia bacterium]|nr:ornithine cyclodeaminase family protein [Clostridia bacterium]